MPEPPLDRLHLRYLCYLLLKKSVVAGSDPPDDAHSDIGWQFFGPLFKLIQTVFAAVGTGTDRSLKQQGFLGSWHGRRAASRRSVCVRGSQTRRARVWGRPRYSIFCAVLMPRAT